MLTRTNSHFVIDEREREREREREACRPPYTFGHLQIVILNFKNVYYNNSQN